MAKEPPKKNRGERPYAERVLPDGRTISYNTRQEYLRGRRQATATAAATRARIRRSLGR